MVGKVTIAGFKVGLLCHDIFSSISNAAIGSVVINMGVSVINFANQKYR